MSIKEKMFPVLYDCDFWKKHPQCPRFIPWRLIEPHEPQALLNHSQTLQRLSERCGLGATEIYAVMHDRGHYPIASEEIAVAFLVELLKSDST